MFFYVSEGRRSVSVNVFCIYVNKQTKKNNKKNLVSYGIRTHDLSIGRQSSTPLRHSDMTYNTVELIIKSGL